jgi:hypothetical protein
MRELLLGAMSASERRGLIRFRRGLTNRDYFFSVRGPARESFGFIASAFEHVYFGRREATPDAFRDSCRAYQRSSRGSCEARRVALPALFLGLLFVGTAGPNPAEPGEDGFLRFRPQRKRSFSISPRDSFPT